MVISILDYKDREKEVDIGDLDDIRSMMVNVVTGDELLHVIYKDGTCKTFDASDDRTRDFYDGCYDLYNEETNVLEKPEWLERTHYSYLQEYGDTSEADLSDWW